MWLVLAIDRCSDIEWSQAMSCGYGAAYEMLFELAATATSALSGRRLAFSAASDTPDQLREMAAAAVADMTADLGSAVDSEPEAE